ncbi:MAG: hypothetical protein P8Z75_11115 [Gammaproteobacteria bacterium]
MNRWQWWFFQAALQLRLQREWIVSMPDKQLVDILSLFTRGIDRKPGFLLVL